jgi:hypothetical protein
MEPASSSDSICLLARGVLRGSVEFAPQSGYFAPFTRGYFDPTP